MWCGLARFIQHPFPKVRDTQLVLLWASGWRGRTGTHCPVGRASTDWGGGRRGQWHSCRAVSQPHGRASLARPPCSRRLSAAPHWQPHARVGTRPFGRAQVAVLRQSLTACLCVEVKVQHEEQEQGTGVQGKPVADVLPSGLLL